MKLCVLVLVGSMSKARRSWWRAAMGCENRSQRWHELQLDLKERNFNAPKVALGDGAARLWAALYEVYLQIPQQRFWVHKSPTCSTRYRNLCSRTRRMTCTRSGW